MTNPFIKGGDDFYAEAYNGAIALFTMGKPEITSELPGDYEGGVFLTGTYPILKFMRIKYDYKQAKPVVRPRSGFTPIWNPSRIGLRFSGPKPKPQVQ